MNDEEFVKWFANLYNEVSKTWNEDNIVANPPQVEKLQKVLEYFKDAATQQNGEIEEVKFDPIEIHGGVTARFLVFSVCGEDAIEKFCDVLQFCSALGIDTDLDGRVCISCTIPDVFRFKNEE